MKSYRLSLVCLLLASFAAAQQPAIKHEQWAENPVLHTMADRYKNESAVVLLDKRMIEFVDMNTDKMEEYRTFHRIVHINDDKGLESFNKIYLGFNDSNDIVEMRARTILPNGSVVNVRREDMKDYQEEKGSRYKIFAMEGLEKGSEVEYFYTVRRGTEFFGRETIQGKFPIAESEIDVLCPARLIFQFKGYNCEAGVNTDTSMPGKSLFSAKLKDIPGAEEEKYAAYKANLQRVEYRLSYNKANGNEHVRLNTWNLLAQRLYEKYEIFTDKELNRIGDMIDANGWSKLPDDARKIISLENYLKSQFTTREDIDMQNAGNIDWMIKNRIASHYGIVRLYAGLFMKLGVAHQIVLTCDRSEITIDKAFENWDNATEFLFYFPGTKKFLAPTLLEYRYPWINPNWAGHDALFCQGTTIGTYTTAIALIRNVPLEDVAQSYTRIDASLKIDPAFDTVMIDIRQSAAGYLATDLRVFFAMAGPDDQRKVIKEFVRSSTNSERVITSKVENAGFDNFIDNKPFSIQATVHSEGLLESAGKNMLLKIGELLGKQTEMYQEKPRQFPMQLPYPHTLERFIDLEIPEGYQIKNLQDIVMHYDYQTDGTTTLGFSSDYKMDGNILRIHVMEQYKKTFYPLTDYENFKKVINAAADFNKLTLALEKK